MQTLTLFLCAHDPRRWLFPPAAAIRKAGGGTDAKFKCCQSFPCEETQGYLEGMRKHWPWHRGICLQWPRCDVPLRSGDVSICVQGRDVLGIEESYVATFTIP